MRYDETISMVRNEQNRAISALYRTVIVTDIDMTRLDGGNAPLILRLNRLNEVTQKHITIVRTFIQKCEQESNTTVQQITLEFTGNGLLKLSYTPGEPVEHTHAAVDTHIYETAVSRRRYVRLLRHMKYPEDKNCAICRGKIDGHVQLFVRFRRHIDYQVLLNITGQPFKVTTALRLWTMVKLAHADMKQGETCQELIWRAYLILCEKKGERYANTFKPLELLAAPNPQSKWTTSESGTWADMRTNHYRRY